MKTLKTLLLSPQLNATEFAARSYPDRARKTAGKALMRCLKGSAPVPEQTTREAAELAALIRRTAGTAAGLGRLVDDARLYRLPLALVAWPNIPQRTAEHLIRNHREGAAFDHAAAERLRAALAKLADELIAAIKCEYSPS